MSQALYRYWVNKAHSVIDIGYENAIQHYANQKRSFLKNLEINSDNVLKEFMVTLNNELDSEIDGELDSTFNEAFSAVTSYIEEYVVQLMQSGNASYDELITIFRDKIKKNNNLTEKQLYNSMKIHIEKFLSINNINRSGLISYVSQKSGLQNSNNTDIQNNIFGYARRLLLQQLNGGELKYSIQHYKTALKGYYKEEVLVSALNKVLKQYNIVATQAGSERNEKGQQIKYDILLGKSSINNSNALTSLIQQMEKMSKTISQQSSTEIGNENLIGGIQSKSWVAPWSEKSYGGNRYFLSFGNNSSLLPQGENKHYWHAGVYNVMSNLTQAIGLGNFIFSTGDTIYWTSELLSEFKERQYVIAFGYNKSESAITSSEISAQQHIDN